MADEDPYTLLKRFLTKYQSTGDEFNTPVPPPSPMRGREPQVVGPPSLGKQAQQLYKIAPTLRETVKDIRMGPIPGTQLVSGMLFNPHSGNEVQGVTDTLSNQVAISPMAGLGMSSSPQDEILAHELAHTAGWNHEGSVYPQDALKALKGMK